MSHFIIFMYTAVIKDGSEWVYILFNDLTLYPKSYFYTVMCSPLLRLDLRIAFGEFCQIRNKAKDKRIWI